MSSMRKAKIFVGSIILSNLLGVSYAAFGHDNPFYVSLFQLLVNGVMFPFAKQSIISVIAEVKTELKSGQMQWFYSKPACCGQTMRRVGRKEWVCDTCNSLTRS